MLATVAPKLQNGHVRALWKANSFIYPDLETPSPNFILNLLLSLLKVSGLIWQGQQTLPY